MSSCLRLSFLTLWVAFVGVYGTLPQRRATAEVPVLLQMIRDDAVHSELKLSQVQQSSVLGAIRDVDPRWWRSRLLKADEQTAEVQELTVSLRDSLTKVLDSSQLQRLRQLERQALGTRMLLRADVIDELGLSEAQVLKLKEAFAKTDVEAIRIQGDLGKGSLDGVAAQDELERLKKSERDVVSETLTAAQQPKIVGLTGQPFDFSEVKRTLPTAPDFESEGATWLQGTPRDWTSLRGKVVAVHFYAFQCINCQRNFPHYEAWHREFADRGLVVVGIQTPETMAERDVERVRAAAASDGFAYPVVMDASASNWKAWGNTMWPTVYLVDKQGFIRRWWQGEMNWQGTDGEKQMRSTIEELLGEAGK